MLTDVERRRKHAERQRLWNARNPGRASELRHAARDTWRQRHPERRAAHQAVYRAVKSGRLVRPNSCARCEAACRPEASHDNYGKPLEVEWLCRTCHVEKDRLSRLADVASESKE